MFWHAITTYSNAVLKDIERIEGRPKTSKPTARRRGDNILCKVFISGYVRVSDTAATVFAARTLENSRYWAGHLTADLVKSEVK